MGCYGEIHNKDVLNIRRKLLSEINTNKNIILITGKPSSGKTTSLINVDATTTAYLNTDLKELPLRNANDFQDVFITDIAELPSYIAGVEEAEGTHLGVLDTLTFAMDMYESQYVINSKNTMQAWGEYAQFYKSFIHQIKSGTKDYVIFAHEKDIYNEKEMTIETKIPVKGAVGNTGVEADFSIILAAKRLPITMLTGFENELLNITEENIEDGFKYVLQTRATKDTVGEKMRSPMGLWTRKQLYIDNDVNAVMQHVKQYYNGEK